MTATIHCGDALTVLRSLPDASARCCVTSPPYWGLRDYGTGTWEGGDATCSHRKVGDPVKAVASSTLDGGKKTTGHLQEGHKTHCPCGAIRVDRQLGLESTPEEYVGKMVEVFREVRRVLTDDGTLWLNLGDSYCTTAPGTRMAGNSGTSTLVRHARLDAQDAERAKNIRPETPNGMKPKDMVGIPWMVAFALRSDGWWLRSEIIWAKKNVMPESVKDRPTKAHEQIFLLAKSARYFYDANSLMEPASVDTHARYARGRSDTHKWADGGPGDQSIAKSFEHMRAPGVNPKAALGKVGRERANPSFSAAGKDVVETRNARTVWDIATKPYAGAHFATFPEELARRCILAGSAPGDTVLDPFGGSGTVGQVATGNGRSATLIELNPEYVHLMQQRIGPMLCTVAA